MPKLLLCAGLVGLAVLGSVAVADDKDKGKAGLKLDGGYTLVSGERDGKAIPAERIKGSIVKFTGNAIVGTDNVSSADRTRSILAS